MKLNKKGYLTVDVILASVVTITIALFLMEITIKLVNITDDAYVNTELLTDKALIIKNIKKLLEEDIKNGGGIKSIQPGNNLEGAKLEIDFCNEDDSENENYYDRYLYIYDYNIIYEDTENGEEFYHKNLNEKYLNNFAITSSKTGEISNGEYILFKITATSKFSKDDFKANIIVYNDKKC